MYLPLINPVCSGLIIIGSLDFILFAMALEAILQSKLSSEIGRKLLIDSASLSFFDNKVIMLCF